MQLVGWQLWDTNKLRSSMNRIPTLKISQIVLLQKSFTMSLPVFSHDEDGHSLYCMGYSIQSEIRLETYMTRITKLLYNDHNQY